jgi:hypothetical protein
LVASSDWKNSRSQQFKNHAIQQLKAECPFFLNSEF